MNKKVVIFILSLIFLIQAVQLIIWIKKDDYPPAWDQSWHAMLSLHKYNQLFGKNNLTTQQVEQRYPIFGFANNFYPPFFHFSAIPFYAVFGTSYDVAFLTNLFFLAILIFSSYFIGRKLHSQKAGLLIAFIVFTIPAYSQFLREYLIDFSLSAMVVLGYAILLYTENFQNLKYSILFGFTFGLGVLTKWTYPLYLAVPAYFSLFPFQKLRLKNALITSVFAILITAFWYIPRIKILLPLFLQFGLEQGRLEGEPVLYSLKNLTYYLLIITNQYSLSYCLLFLLMGFFCLRYKIKKLFLPGLNILAIYALFTVILNKNDRYILPIYIFMALVMGIGIWAIKNRLMKYCLLFLIVAVGFLQNITYTLQAIPKRSQPEINIEEVLSVINTSKQGKEFSVCIISETEELNDVNIPYYAFKNNYPVSFMIGNGCDPLEFDYSIVGPIAKTWRSRAFERSKKILEDNMDRLELIYSENKVRVYEQI